MLKFSKVGVLMAVMAFSGLMASSASAANWHTNGHRRSPALTRAPLVWLFIQPRRRTVLVECPSSTGSGTINGPTSRGLAFWTSAATVTPMFGGPNCTVTGVPGFSGRLQFG